MVYERDVVHNRRTGRIRDVACDRIAFHRSPSEHAQSPSRKGEEAIGLIERWTLRKGIGLLLRRGHCKRGIVLIAPCPQAMRSN